MQKKTGSVIALLIGLIITTSFSQSVMAQSYDSNATNTIFDLTVSNVTGLSGEVILRWYPNLKKISSFKLRYMQIDIQEFKEICSIRGNTGNGSWAIEKRGGG